MFQKSEWVKQKSNPPIKKKNSSFLSGVAFYSKKVHVKTADREENKKWVKKMGRENGMQMHDGA